MEYQTRVRTYIFRNTWISAGLAILSACEWNGEAAGDSHSDAAHTGATAQLGEDIQLGQDLNLTGSVAESNPCGSDMYGRADLEISVESEEINFSNYTFSLPIEITWTIKDSTMESRIISTKDVVSHEAQAVYTPPLYMGESVIGYAINGKLKKLSDHEGNSNKSAKLNVSARRLAKPDNSESQFYCSFSNFQTLPRQTDSNGQPSPIGWRLKDDNVGCPRDMSRRAIIRSPKTLLQHKDVWIHYSVTSAADALGNAADISDGSKHLMSDSILEGHFPGFISFADLKNARAIDIGYELDYLDGNDRDGVRSERARVEQLLNDTSFKPLEYVVGCFPQ